MPFSENHNCIKIVRILFYKKTGPSRPISSQSCNTYNLFESMGPSDVVLHTIEINWQNHINFLWVSLMERVYNYKRNFTKSRSDPV